MFWPLFSSLLRPLLLLLLPPLLPLLSSLPLCITPSLLHIPSLPLPSSSTPPPYSLLFSPLIFSRSLLRYNISIGRLDPDDEDQFLTDEEDSSGVHVVAPSIPGSHDPEYDDWADVPYPEDIKPSDSASRPRTSHRNRSIHGSRSASARRPTSRRHMESYPPPRARRQASPADSAGSGDSEDYPQQYARPPREHRWPQVPPVAPAPNYAQSASSGQTFPGFPPGHPAYQHPNGALPSDQLIRHANPGAQPPYGGHGYPPYGHQFQGPHGAAAAGMHPYYAQDPAHPRHPRQPGAQHPSQPPIPHPMSMHSTPSPFGGSPFGHEMMPYGANAYYNYPRDPYAMMAAMPPQSYFPHYPHVASPPPQPEPTPAPAAASPTPAPEPAPAAPPPADTAKDEAIARLEKLILDDRTEREAREAAKIAKAEEEARAAAALEAQLAHDRKIAGEAAALARADAEKRAAEEATKAKEEAEKAAAAAASEAAAAATAAAAAAATDAANAAAAEAEKAANKPPPEKKKPIKFKDAVGRKFSFPFELCATWKGMEDLIKQAFLHIEVIGPHVAEGHYDLVGPNGDIILPQVWETVIEPDWSITMHMWPIPEKPKDPDPPPADAPPAEPPKDAAPAAAEPPKKAAPKKAKPNAGAPGGFANWMMGGRKPPKPKAAPKAEKKPEAAPAPAP